MTEQRSKKTRKIRCPVCKEEVPLQSKPPTFPFCSERCKAVDLNRWMSGEYGLDPQSGSLDRVDPEEAEDVSGSFYEH
jgi:endogenous inhibitor of DNA gyrase (YacG/DUF329 family)